jgi:transcriptional regulator with XRE-family HTH domain
MSRPLDENKPHRDQQIVDMILSGKTKPEIMRTWGCGPGVVERADQLIIQIQQRLDRGVSKQDISRELNCTPNTVDMVKAASTAVISNLKSKQRKPHAELPPIDAHHTRLGQTIRWLYDSTVSQSDFAILARITDARLRQIIAGTHSPTLHELERIAQALGLGTVAERMTKDAQKALSVKLRVPVDRLKEEVSDVILTKMLVSPEEVLRCHVRDKSGALNIEIRKVVTDHLHREKEGMLGQRV